MFDPERLIGRVVGGQYRIETLLGRGGFGAVYRALDLHLDRPVAVKVITHAGREVLVHRFRREARVQSRLRHPAIVRLLEFDVDGAMPIMVQEFVDGRTLRSVVEREGPLSLDRAVALFAELLDALDEAHALGIAHRDLKPDNIMVVQTRRGEEVRLLDFGIAKLLDHDDDHQLTATGMLLGTPSWLAPEQVTQQPITHKCDLYSLGCVLYWALTGDKPYQGSLTQVLTAHASAPPPPMPAGLPPHIRDALLCAMEKDPAARFESADDMRAALLGLGATRPHRLAGDPGDPTPLSISNLTVPPESTATPAASSRWPRIAAVAIALAALATLVVLAAVGPFGAVGVRSAGAPPLDAGVDAAPTPDAAPPLADAAPITDRAPPPAPDAEPPAPDALADPLTGPVPARTPAPSAAQQRRARVAALDRALTADLRRCRCSAARATVDQLRAEGVDRRSTYAAACRRATEGALGTCGAGLKTRLETAMKTCPCADAATRRLVDRLSNEFGLDRSAAWARRCATPGLPGSCP